MAEPVNIRVEAEDKATPVLKEVRRGIENLDKSSRSLSDTMKSVLAGAVGGLTASLASLAMQGISAVASSVGGAINTFADFESGLLTLRAVSGATGEALELMKQRALELGESTRFSASESLNAMIELAKGGVSVKEIYDDAARAALDLASAGGVDLSEAAEIIAKQLAVWRDSNLKASEAATILASVANATTTSVSEMKYGLASAGSVARDVGMSFKETVIGIAAVVPAASSAQDAGTAMRSAFMRLLNPTKEVRKLMDALNISLHDSNGQFVGLANFAEQLRVAFEGMTEAQRSALLAALGGSDAFRALSALANLGADGIRQIEAEIDKLGSASDQASQMNRGLGFALDELNAKFETLSIRLGEKLAPYIIQFANLVGDAVGKVSAAISSIQLPELNLDTLIAAISKITGLSLAEARGEFARYQAAISAVVEAFETHLAPAIEQYLLPAINQLIAAGQKLISAVLGLVIDNTGRSADLFSALAGVIGDVLVPAFSLFVHVVSDLISLVSDLINLVRNELIRAFHAVGEVVPKIGETIMGALGGAIEWVRARIGEFTETIRNIYTKIKPALKAIGLGDELQALEQLRSGVSSITRSVGTGLGEQVADYIQRKLKIGRYAPPEVTIYGQSVVENSRAVNELNKTYRDTSSQMANATRKATNIMVGAADDMDKKLKRKDYFFELGSIGQTLRSLVEAPRDKANRAISDLASRVLALQEQWEVGGVSADEVKKQVMDLSTAAAKAARYIEDSPAMQMVMRHIFGLANMLNEGFNQPALAQTLEIVRRDLIGILQPMALKESEEIQARRLFADSVVGFTDAVRIFHEAASIASYWARQPTFIIEPQIVGQDMRLIQRAR